MEIFVMSAAGIYDWPIIKQVSWLLGQVMNGIYNALSAIGIENIGVAIIVFTIIVYTLLLPLTIKQQKFTKMSAVMQPEIQKIQKRYANKKDQASMLKQQEEMNMVYDKYGLKMSSGCLPSLLQLVFLFGLYPVVQNIPEYVTKVRNVYIPLVEKIQATTGYEKIMSSLATGLVPGAESLDYTKAGNMIEVMYKFQSSTWNELVDKMPKLESVVNNTMSEVSHLNNFLGVDIGAHPWNLLTDALAAASIAGVIIAVLIPVLAGLTQFISVKLSQAGAGGAAMSDDNPMAASMKTMTYTMPLISVVFGFTLPAGLGLYWVASAAVRSVQQLAVNKYLSKKSIDDIIKENQEKAKKKREKKGTSAEEINKMATTSTRNVGTSSSKAKGRAIDAEKEEKIRKAQELAKNAKPGSLTSKANLVNKYNSGVKTEEVIPEKQDNKKKKYTVCGKGMNGMKGSIRVSAKTLDDAITEALIQLGVTSDRLEYNVIEKGSAGFLGIGMKQAVIEAWKKEDKEEEEFLKAVEETIRENPVKEYFAKEDNVKEDDVKEHQAEEAAKKEEAVREEKTEKEEASANAKEEKSEPVSVKEKELLAKVEDETIRYVEQFVKDTLKAMDMDVEITSSIDKDGALYVDMKGENMGILIGKRGQTLDSLQYLANRVANKHQSGYVRVKLDTENYRARREETLKHLAKNIAHKVKRNRRPVILEPMNPYERRIIHSTLQSDPYVTTHSEGEEPYRKVVVTLKR